MLIEIRDVLLSMSWWGYVAVAPVFVVLNLAVAVGIVEFLKRRTPEIQEDPKPSAKTWSVTRTLSLNYALLAGFAAVTLYHLAHGSNVSWSEYSLVNTVLAVVVVMVANDVLYYPYHRLMHTDFFWNRMHYIHHESRSPGGLRDTFYEHPVDFLVGTACATIPLFFMPINIVAASVCLFLQTFLAVSYHSGHEIKVPKIFTARRHDDHHRYYRGNYAQNFALVDTMFGTVISKKKPVAKSRSGAPESYPVAVGTTDRTPVDAARS